MPESRLPAIGGKTPSIYIPLYRNPSALRTAAFIAKNWSLVSSAIL
ncbi:hypothetical protein VO64_3499 [Pseudomonas synxantha]|uniref:Uncharacterized protein n=1 Tax=Pseudomonas synxantha TaxID=47883 RepID=A0AAU8TNR8_9PSED|nr:hypothetical protein VO64_3499 [Pseudomonas synxantha]